MPNWTANKVTIWGDDAQLEEFIQLAKGDVSPLCFNNIRPMPKELLSDLWQSDKGVAKANSEKFGHDGWYSWRVANWGTKWDVDTGEDVEFFEQGKHADGTRRVRYNFNTAWADAAEVFIHASERFPNLYFEYEAHEEAKCWESFVALIHAGKRFHETEIRHMDDYTDANELADELDYAQQEVNRLSEAVRLALVQLGVNNVEKAKETLTKALR